MLRCAKEFGLRARAFSANRRRLAETPCPGIAALKDGNFLIIGKIGDGKILVQAPGSPKPVIMTQTEFEEVWDGRIVLMTRRAPRHLAPRSQRIFDAAKRMKERCLAFPCRRRFLPRK
jgi:subfamily B ATP-binding cassette protein HlyB/CyaB